MSIEGDNCRGHAVHFEFAPHIFRFSPEIRRIVATLRTGFILNAPEPASKFVQRPRQSSPLMFSRRAGAAKQNARRPGAGGEPEVPVRIGLER